MTYPTLNLKALANLQVIQENIRADADWLANSPYDLTIRELLAKLFPQETQIVGVAEAPKRRGKKSKGGLTDDDLEEVEKESKGLLEELKKIKLGDRIDTAEKLNIIRLQTTLMEKIISVRERASNIRAQSHFQDTVLTILDDLLDEDHRHEFIKRMEDFV